MDFAPTEDQTMIFDIAYGLGQEHIAPYALEWEKAGTIPKDRWPKLAELGFGGLYVREEQGGAGPKSLGCDTGVRSAEHGLSGNSGVFIDP